MSPLRGWMMFCLAAAWMLPSQEPSVRVRPRARPRPSQRQVAQKDLPPAPPTAPEDNLHLVARLPRPSGPVAPLLTPGCRF